MPKQRDGPAPRQTAPSQRQQDERAPVLPSPKSLRNTPARDTSPPHHRSRRRQPQGWREFRVRLCIPPGSNGAHALYAFLKLAAQRYGLEVASVDELSELPRSND
jgi:hypothetical protein